MTDVAKREDRLLDKISALVQQKRSAIERMQELQAIDPSLELVFTDIRTALTKENTPE